MGRRSTRTTKTGKFMNPTDQWRKQCRRKELKKNKVQRQTVRDAVLRSKNPWEMLEEIEEIEKLEIESGVSGDTENPNEKGLKEKKKKLHDTLSRLIKYYDREDPKKATEIKRMVVESENKRRDMSKVYNSYRAARSEIDVSDIPLPDQSGDTGVMAPDDIPMPAALDPDDEDAELVPPGPPPGPPPDSIVGLIPPGPPSVPPPTFPPAVPSSSRGSRAVRFAEESDDRKGESESSDDDCVEDDDRNEDDRQESGKERDSQQDKNEVDKQAGDEESQLLLMPPPPGPPPGPPPPLFPHHTITPLFSQVPAPPPGLPPNLPPPSKFSVHPPRPPPMPQPLIPQSKPTGTRGSPHIQSSPIISKGSSSSKAVQQAATISAQPQLRNMQAEVTKFLPTTLRVRREQPRVVKSKPRPATTSGTMVAAGQGEQRRPTASGGSAVKEDEYKAFMKQMQGLI